MKETQSGNHKKRKKNLTGKKNDEAEVAEQKRAVRKLQSAALVSRGPATEEDTQHRRKTRGLRVSQEDEGEKTGQKLSSSKHTRIFRTCKVHETQGPGGGARTEEPAGGAAEPENTTQTPSSREGPVAKCSRTGGTDLSLPAPLKSNDKPRKKVKRQPKGEYESRLRRAKRSGTPALEERHSHGAAHDLPPNRSVQTGLS